jgi:hypothetical protein
VAQRWRLGLFCAVCAALLAAAIGFAGGGQPPAPAPPPPRSEVVPAAPPSPQPAAGEAAGLRARLGGAARRFFAAFFQYEVGELGPGVRRALRATATPGFAAELLGAPPRSPPQSVAAAVPGPLAIAVASLTPPRALVSGSARRRGGEAEQFSFVFEAVDGAWLASGPGE